jgi:hypothetical protein
MTILAAGASASVSLPAGQFIQVIGGSGTAVVQNMPGAVPIQLDGDTKIGPFDAARVVGLSATTAIDYTATDGVLVGLTPTQAAAVARLVSQGNGYEPTIGSTVTMRVTVDAGSDVDHAEVLFTFNAGPTADIAIASERFTNADARADVIKTALTGAAADGGVYSFSLPSGLTNAWVALRGSGPYTLASGATTTLLQAVAANWSGSLGLKYCTMTVGGPYVGGGTNKRYRDIIITGFVGV